MPRKYINYQNSFTSLIKESYELYFACKVGDLNKNWALYICCLTCTLLFTGWINNGSRDTPFAIPVILREPKDHVSGCYLCLANITGITSKSVSYTHLDVYKRQLIDS